VTVDVSWKTPISNLVLGHRISALKAFRLARFAMVRPPVTFLHKGLVEILAIMWLISGYSINPSTLYLAIRLIST
jgi:hypothetical protein